MNKVYHLNICKKDLRGAKTALLPGDPGRCHLIAAEIAKAYGGEAVFLASKREFTSYVVKSHTFATAVVSTGIGGPSSAIAVEELAHLGIRTFIRVGTTGSLQPYMKPGEVVITTAAVRLDGASRQYAPIEFPAVSDFDVTQALVQGAKQSRIGYHLGITASTDTFYQGEERADRFRKYTLRSVRGSSAEWRSLGVLNYEMEAATIFTMTASMGLRAGCVTGVVNKGGVGKITEKNLAAGIRGAVKTAVSALRYAK